MDTLEAIMESRLDKIQELNDFIALFGKKAEIIDRLSHLKSLTEKQKILIAKINENNVKFESSAKQQSKLLLDKMQRQQTIMLEMLEELTRRDKLAAENLQNKSPKPSSSTSWPSGLNKAEPVTPRISVLDYQNSPFAKRVRPIALQFIDFDAEIKQETFDMIPAYLRGRETLDELVAFLNDTIIRCFTNKYQLLYKKREVIKGVDLTQYNQYRLQEQYFANEKFITQGDISYMLNRLVDKKALMRIQMLRHIQIIKEVHKKGITFYIWCST